jgi:peptidyl-prolyl cis-trans isomerase D
MMPRFAPVVGFPGFKMLNSLRKGAGSLPAKIFFGALVASFAVWGVGDVFNQGGRDEMVAEIGDSQISSRVFADSYRRQLNALSQLNISAEQAQGLGLHRRLLDTLISQRLYNLQARDLGIYVSDRALNAEIRSQAAFRDEFGQFDRGRFQSALLRDGRSEGAFVDELRHEIHREQVIDSLVPGIPPPPTLADNLHRWRGERRVAKVARIVVAPATIAAPSEGELDTYHKANTDRFTSPESRVVSYIHFLPEHFSDEINVSEQQLRDEYASRAVDLATPERRTILQVQLDDEAAVIEAAARIAAGEAFADVATQLVAGADLSLGTVTQNELPIEFAETAFGESSAPIESPFGWHLVHVSKIEPGSTPTFEQLRDELKKTIAEESAVDVMYSMANQLEDSLGGGASVEEAASSLGLHMGRIDGVDRNGRDANGVPLDALPGGSRLLENAFNIEVGEESTLTETDDGGYLIVRVDAIRPPSLRPIASIHEQVTSAWQAEKAQELEVEQARRLVEQLNVGITLGEESAHQALTIVMSEPFTRNGNGAGGALPLSIVGDLFEIKLGGAVMAEVNGGAVVAQLADIQSADTAPQSVQNEVAMQLRSEYSGDMLEQLRAELQRQYGVIINQSALDALY